MIKQYIEKPNVVEGIMWDGQNEAEVISFAHPGAYRPGSGDIINVFVSGGIVEAKLGDYIVRDHSNRFAVFSPEEFREKFKQI